MGETQSDFTPSFAQSKLARKKAEEDAKLLMTRIQLLKKEEQKVLAQAECVGLEKDRRNEEKSPLNTRTQIA